MSMPHRSLREDIQNPRQHVLPPDAQFSSLPEVYVPSGKEVVMTNQKEAVVLFRRDDKMLCDGQALLPAYSRDSSSHKQLSDKRRNRLALWICALITVLMILGIALGVGLGISLKSKKSSPPDTSGPTPSPTDVNGPEPDSTRGAFNGSGLSILKLTPARNLTSPNSVPDSTNQSSHLLLFQHHSGEIRWMQRTYLGAWFGGSPYEVIATDAKNNTPISVATSRLGDANQISVFYIDQENMLRQRSIDNLTFAWSDGLINGLNIKTLDAETVGMTVGFYSGPIGGINLNGTDPNSGMRLWVATSESQFDQYSWRPGLSQWVWEQSWQDQNGSASPAIYSWAPGTTTYVVFVDLENSANLWWKDTGSDLVNTESHPINQWSKSPVTISDIDPTTGLAFHENLYGKTSDGLVRSWNISFAAENSTLLSSDSSPVDGRPDASARSISVCSLYSTPGTAIENLVFFQTMGDDITMFSRSVSTGVWNSTALPIPNA